MPCNTPVVFLIFRRPDLTAQVFEAIRQAQPKMLLVVADGPRNEAEATLCQQARAVTEQVDWDCEVLRDYSEVNLGCRDRVASGITWAFEQVEEAIILEDDCLPSPSFFLFCQELLEKYRYDTRIMHIAGANFVSDSFAISDSYYFSQYASIWGWATWSRAWKYYNSTIENWLTQRDSGILDNIYSHASEVQDREKIIGDVCAGKIDSWAYQWDLACRLQHSLSVIPAKNLISNIGFREDASRTKSKSDIRANLLTSDLLKIYHPPFIVENKIIDKFRYENHFKTRQKIGLLRATKRKMHPYYIKIKSLIKSSV
jgi:hypothetical protein